MKSFVAPACMPRPRHCLACRSRDTTLHAETARLPLMTAAASLLFDGLGFLTMIDQSPLQNTNNILNIECVSCWMAIQMQ